MIGRKPVATYMQAGTPHVVFDDGAVFAGYDGHSGKTRWTEDSPLPGTVRDLEVNRGKRKESKAEG